MLRETDFSRNRVRYFPQSLPTWGLKMKSKRYTKEQIIGSLKVHESGAKVADLVRQHGFSEQSFYRCRSITRLSLEIF